MKYIEAIEKRQSIREFRKKELSDKQIAEIKEFYGSFKPLIPEIGTELVVSTGEEIGTRLEGSAGYRGHSFNAPAYITILSEVKDHYLINAGYLAENILLKLVEMDIDHCWLTTNGSDNVKRALFLGDKDKEAVVVIACGFGKKERSLTRLDIQTPSNVKVSKRAGHIAPKIAQDEMVYHKAWGRPVDWEAVDPHLDLAFYAGSLAPSFLNKQPYRYVLAEPYVILYRLKEDQGTTYEDLFLDAGATMANFEAVFEDYSSFDRKWNCDVPEEILQAGAPDDYEAVAYYTLV